MILTPGIVLVFFIIMITGIALFTIKYNRIANQRSLGELQFELISFGQSTEQPLIYIDNSAKYSAINVAYNLSSNGGIAGESACGRIGEFNLWTNKEGKECVPDAKSNYKTAFARSFGKYISGKKFNISQNKTMPEGNYNYLIKSESGKTKIEGFSSYDLYFEKGGYQYTYKPSFAIAIDYDLNQYEIMKNKAIGVMYMCFNKTSSDLDNCVKNEFISPYEVNQIEDRTYSLTYESGRLLFREEPIKYKFAFYISNNKSKLPKMTGNNQQIFNVDANTINSISTIYSMKYSQVEVAPLDPVVNDLVYNIPREEIAVAPVTQPTPTPTPIPAPSPEPTPQPTPAPTPAPEPTPIPTPTPTYQPEPTPIPVPQPTPTPSPEPTPTPSPTPVYTGSGIDPKVIQAIIKQESNNNPNSIKCEKSYEKRWKELAENMKCTGYGCDQTFLQGPWQGFHKISCSYGLMQLMYPTALESCKNIVTTPESLSDPNINVECGTIYLKRMINYCGSLQRAIYAYNHGPANCKTADVANDVYVASVTRNCRVLGCEITA